MVRKIKVKKHKPSKNIGEVLQIAREKSPYIINLRNKYHLCKPCTEWGDNRDIELEKKGVELLIKRELEGAKEAFEELLAISTFHHSPCEFLAYTLYLKKEEKELREWLMDEVVKTAIFFYEENTLDREVLDEILENQRRMKEGKDLVKWWE